VIARVNGAAVGGGAGLVAASDISVGVEKANFGFTEVKLGLIPAVISPFVIDRIGNANAYRYFLTGERFNAVTAKEIGLLQEVVASEEELDARVDIMAKEICENSPQAVTLCKKLIQGVQNKSYFESTTRAYLANEIASIRVSSEGQEGLSAFLGKRKPAWKS
jgi:methylglutaconyl-CoA hydratase